MITPRGGWDRAALVGKMDCPNCHLVSPPNTRRCDCGYDFATGQIEKRSARIVRGSYVAAFVVAGLGVISALATQITILPLACIPLIAGIGIMRKRTWSAYGYALYQFAQVLPVPLLLFRPGGLAGGSVRIITSSLLSLALCVVFFFAGRSLQADKRAKHGWPLAWIAVSAISILPLIFVQPFLVPTAGMENTLLPGDRILVQRFPKPKPVRGMIIVFVYPMDRSQNYVKRIVGVPGDRIRIVNKYLYVNDMKLDEPYKVHQTEYIDPYRDNFPSKPNIRIFPGAVDMLQNHVVNGEVVVPEGELFVLGDNRDNSADSRYWGFVDSGDLLGKPFLIYDSRATQPRFLIGGIWAELRAVFVSLAPVRWSRLFKTL
jgi:signal peptidase I